MPLVYMIRGCLYLAAGNLGGLAPPVSLLLPFFLSIVATVSLPHSTLPHSCWEGEAPPPQQLFLLMGGLEAKGL